MRHLRLLTGLVAAFAMVLFALTAAPAGAAPAGVPSSASADAGLNRAKPTHEFEFLKECKKRNGRFCLTGKIYTYKGKRVKLQKSKREKGVYRTFTQQKTNRFGKFTVRFKQPVGTHIRLLVPGTPRNKVTRIYIGKIVRKYA